jgi:hypothetical protein
VKRPFRGGGRTGRPGGGQGVAALGVGGGTDRVAMLCVMGGRG